MFEIFPEIGSLDVNQGRLLVEIDYMLAYSSGEASLRLLWKFGLLGILFPFQAAYFTHHGFRRRDKRTNMLLVSGNFMLLRRVFKNMLVTLHMIPAYDFHIEYAIWQVHFVPLDNALMPVRPLLTRTYLLAG
ncbi:uncharacterized protein LOC123918253 isoform X1 [Trifolium pratense]|uniref:uncharacterized protein LOC123918253 isoform X1 n=1 Tax=Trifolium pratense TaxID=57577 RepID=UPI001E69427D|nr:uncharacterized protein LOC123918253 isoform X1 [Trifolium pratense]